MERGDPRVKRLNRVQWAWKKRVGDQAPCSRNASACLFWGPWYLQSRTELTLHLREHQDKALPAAGWMQPVLWASSGQHPSESPAPSHVRTAEPGPGNEEELGPAFKTLLRVRLWGKGLHEIFVATEKAQWSRSRGLAGTVCGSWPEEQLDVRWGVHHSISRCLDFLVSEMS